MGYGITVLFYLTIGIGVAIALWVVEDTSRNPQKLFQALTAPFFWPIYIPVLLVSRPAATFAKTTSPQRQSADAMALLINQVESELDTAFRSLEGWAENVLADERDRIEELRAAWHQQADRIRELDQLLAVTPTETSTPEPLPEPFDTIATEQQRLARTETDNENPSRIAASERMRHENMLKLKTVRDQMYGDLMATLAWVPELVTMIHLAKYTGAPASRAEELVQKIAAAVEELSEVVHQSTSA